MSAVAELTQRSRGPEVLAKHGGPCKGCDKPITAGEDYICVVDNVGTMHALCAANYCQILEDHLEDDIDNDGADSAGLES